MSRYLAESSIEEAAIEWLTAIPGYNYCYGPDILRSLNKVVLEDRFEQFLQTRYNHVPAKILAEVQLEFLHNKGGDIYYRNLDFHQKLSKGISKTWKDDNGKPQFEHFYPVAYDDVTANDFLVVNQFTIEGRNKRRPDLIIFV